MQSVRHQRISWIILMMLGIVVMGGLFFFLDNSESLKDVDTWRFLAEEYPIAAPFIIIIFIVIEVVIAPLPGGFLPIVTGFLFGPIMGTLYSWTGNVLGAMLAWYLAHTFGRSLVKRLVKKSTLDFYDNFLKSKQHLIWILYAIPLFPVDVISLSLGLSNITFKRFTLMITLALLPSMFILNYLGDIIYETRIAALFLIISLGLVLYFVVSFTKEWRQKTRQ